MCRVECLAKHDLTLQARAGVRERLLAALAPVPKKEALVDRAVLTCEMTPETMDPLVTAYWDGVHRIHSQNQPATVFRDFRAGGSS